MNTRLTLKSLFGAVGMLAILLTSCAAAPLLRESGMADNRSYEQPMPAPQAPAVDEASAGAPAGNALPQLPQQERLIIRTADMTIVVKGTQEQLEALTQLATKYGGFVVSSGTSKIGNETQAQLTLRVDAKNFDAALSDIRKLALDVRSENIRGEDVTAEYVDLESQLKNLEAAEAQLTKIMENATKTEDVLSVYEQLTQIRGQIEQAKGRMKYLSQSAALSTINVTLIPDALAQPVEVGGWRFEGVLKSAVEALIGTLQALASIAVWAVIVLLPVLLIVAIPVVLVVWLIRRIRRNRKAAKPAAPPPATPPSAA